MKSAFVVSMGEETAEVFSAAAGGSLFAQRHLRQDRLDKFKQGGPRSPLFGFEALTLAQICAAHGEAEDARILAGLLYQNCLLFRSINESVLADALATESICILKTLGDAGDEMAATSASALIPYQSHDVLHNCMRVLTGKANV